MKTACLLSLVILIGRAAIAQDGNSHEQIVNSLNRALESAYAKADVPALTALFTEDAHYTSEDGTEYVGKAGLESALNSLFSESPGVRLAIESRSIRALAPGVLAENGVSTSTPKDGESNSSQFTAIYVQKDGKWKISELIESPVPDTTPADHLAELAWLAGKWTESDPGNDIEVSSEYSYARGGSFLTRNITVKNGGKPSLEGWQIIGWDPVQQRIRSWTFDSEGGFSDGFWTRDGDRWLIREMGFAPDGSRNTADLTIHKISADRFTWESNNRTLDGDPLPSIDRIEIIRAKGN